MKKKYEKEFIVKKGQQEYKVWSRATDILYAFMTNKKPWYGGKRPAKRPIKVRIEVYS